MRTNAPTTARSPRIGTRGLVVFYITNLVGAGLLILPCLADRIAGPASLLSWAVLVLLSLPVARLFADVSSRHPECGAVSAMITSGLGRTAGETANLLLVVAVVLYNPVMGIASANYACDLLGLPGSYTMPIAAFCMLLSVAFCLARLGTTAKVQGLALVALIAGLAAAVALALPTMSAQRLEPFAPHGWLGIGSAIPLVFLSFIGWEGVSAIAGEVRDPARSFPRAVGVAVPVVGVIYLTVVVAFVAMPHAPDALVMPTLLTPEAGHHAQALGDVLALVVIGLCTNSNVVCGSRLVVAAAQNGLLPARLARRSERTGAPAAALLALAGAYVLMIAASAALGLDETAFVALTTAIFMVIYLTTAAAVLRERPSRTIFMSALVTGGGAVCMLPFTGLALPLAGALTILLALVAVGGGRSRHATDSQHGRHPTRGDLALPGQVAGR